MKSYFCKVNGTILISYHFLRFELNFLERIYKVIIVIGEKLEMIKHKTALGKMLKKPALSSGKIDKCEYLTGKKLLSTGPYQMEEQPNFTYSPLE